MPGKRTKTSSYIKGAGIACWAVLLVTACQTAPFIKRKLSFTRLPGTCTTQPANLRMISNIGGERFEFQQCLPISFNEKQWQVTRQGDTVVLAFHRPESVEEMALFQLTLDIDSYPLYDFITIGADTYPIGHSK